MCLILLFSTSCCFNAGKRLGNNFQFIVDNRDFQVILYCNDYCCNSGTDAVPPKVVSYNYNSKWIIAKSYDRDKDSIYYWIIDKDFKIEYDEHTDKKLKQQIIGNLDSVSFYKKLEELNINLKLRNVE